MERDFLHKKNNFFFDATGHTLPSYYVARRRIELPQLCKISLEQKKTDKMRNNDLRVIDSSCCEVNHTLFCIWPSEYFSFFLLTDITDTT